MAKLKLEFDFPMMDKKKVEEMEPKIIKGFGLLFNSKKELKESKIVSKVTE